MTSATLQPRSGLIAYDKARFTDWTPTIENVARGGPIERLMQMVPAGAIGDNETIVPPHLDKLMLMFWRSGAPYLKCRIGGEPFESPIASWGYTVLPAEADSFWISSPEAAHEVCHVHLDIAAVKRIALEDGRSGLATALPPRVGAADPMMSEIARTIMEEPPGGPRLLWDTMAAALALRLFRIEQGAPGTPRLRGGLPERIRKRVIDHMADHLTEDIRLSELAGLAGLSQHHFCRAFKQATGLPPHRYLLRLRVDRAKDLLDNTRLPISDIAAAVGYDDQGQLARLFRNEVGISPSHYRRVRL
jgi:AraC-like DNA-binding protein